MLATNRPLFQILNGTTQFTIPVFQRDYSWEERQCVQLWNDILRTGEGTEESWHFFGSVVAAPDPGGSPGFARWRVIDGQQRLVTVTVLAAALRDHLRNGSSPGSRPGSEADRGLAGRIEREPAVESGSPEAEQSKLVLRRRDDATLRAIVRGGDPPQDESPRLRAAYSFFRERLRHLSDCGAAHRGIVRLAVVDITLQAEDRPQLVFESLNSTGLALSQADQIRNFVLLNLPGAKQERLYETYWRKIEHYFRGSPANLDSFLRDYVRLRKRRVDTIGASAIYQTFRKEFPSLEDEAGGLEATLGAIERQARCYAAFTEEGLVERPKAVRDALGRLRGLAETPALLVSELLRFHCETKNPDEKNLVESLRLIESYLVRRAVCDLQTRGYGREFVRLALMVFAEAPLESCEPPWTGCGTSFRPIGSSGMP